MDDRIYVIRDPNVNSAPASYDYSPSGGPYTEADLYDATDNLIQDGNTSQKTAASLSLNNAKGWFVQLEGTGEKIVGNSLIYKGALLINSFVPRSFLNLTCVAYGPGFGYTYALDIEDATSVLDLNHSGGIILNKVDRKKTLITPSIPPAPTVRARGDGTIDICVGNECEEDKIASPSTTHVLRRYWRENQ